MLNRHQCWTGTRQAGKQAGKGAEQVPGQARKQTDPALAGAAQAHWAGAAQALRALR